MTAIHPDSQATSFYLINQLLQKAIAAVQSRPGPIQQLSTYTLPPECWQSVGRSIYLHQGLNTHNKVETVACPGLAGVISPIVLGGGLILRAAQLPYLSDFVAGAGAMKTEQVNIILQ